MWTETVGAKCVIIKRWHTNVFMLQQHCYFAININSHSCKLVEHNNFSDMVKCSWTYSTRHASLLKELISATCSWTASITKEMLSELEFNCLWLRIWKIYVITNRMYKHLIIQRWHIKVYLFQQRCCFH